MCLHAKSLQSCLTLCNPFPWDSPGKDTGVGGHALLQRIFLIQGSNLCLLSLLHWQGFSFPPVPRGTPLQSSCLENPTDGGAWWAAVHGVARSPTRLSDFTFTSHFHALEKEMATHFSILTWEISWTEETGGLQSMRLERVEHD